MTPIQFPQSRIAPVEDITERGAVTVLSVVRDFERALAEATTVDRAIQLRQRLAICVDMLTEAENQALQKMEQL